MHFSTSTKLFVGILLVRTSIAGYTLTDDYSKETFFGNFTAFTDKDPTNGFVQYIGYQNATTQKLIGTISNANEASYIGVDYNTQSTTVGRASVRINSKKAFNKGLFIVDVAHMPTGCGTWPAFWLVGPNWPASGEIDIIEGVNANTNNQMTLHTSAGCSIQKTGFTGNVSTTNCDGDAPGQGKNAGCAITAQTQDTYGTGFNTAGGGVYATQWESSGVAVWFWSRNAIPPDVTTGTSPDPSKWGTPLALFSGACDIDQHLQNMQIVFDTTFCGDWAGKTWETSSCKASTGKASCEEWVGGNPGAFGEAYWLVNSLRVYKQGGGSNATSR